MTSTAMLIAALVLLAVVGLVTWTWWAIARVEAQMQSFSGFDGLHLED